MRSVTTRLGAAFAATSMLAIGIAAVAPATPPALAATNPSLPGTAGPSLLRRPLATAPQLTNAGVWRAAPILVSGAVSYRTNEFVYQDYLYDDHGAEGTIDDPGNPQNGDSDGNSYPQGSYTYPKAAAYHGNAADLVEFRMRPAATSTAFRLTLNTLTDPNLVGFTVALGDSGQPRAYPFGANVDGPAAVFLTVHGATAVLTDAITGAVLTPTATVAIDQARRQFTVRVPRAAWDPGSTTTRLAVGVGLWDGAKNAYLLPQFAADDSHPGGSGILAKPAAFFNVGFRLDEPVGNLNYWRDKGQATALAANDMSPYTTTVDLTKVASGTTDDSKVPSSGFINRIMSSHFDLGQGVDFTRACLVGATPNCTGPYLGQLQPYALYIPPLKTPATRYGLTVLLHAYTENYNEFLGTKHATQYGNRGTGSIVLTPEARGPDGGYYAYALADVFEAWADTASHYALDPGWTAISGYSMGGYGTLQLAELYPDLFGRAVPVVGSGYGHYQRLASLRNIPVLMWNASADYLVPVAEYSYDAALFTEMGYRFEQDVFTPAEHLTLAINDEFGPAAAFLGPKSVGQVRANPAHITYIADPLELQPSLGLMADHAYWVSSIRVRTPGSEFGYDDTLTDGNVDAFSHGFGTGDPAATPGAGAGVLTGGNIPALPFTRTYQMWGPAPAQAVANQIDLKLTNVGALTISVARAHVDCNVDLHVTTDGPVHVTLAGCGKTLSFGA